MSRHATVLAAGVAVAGAATLLTHPLALAALAVLAWALVRRSGALEQAPWLPKLVAGLAVAVVAFNALFSWNGATELYRAPFRIALLGRPRLTLEAMAWGGVAGLQLGVVVASLTAATLTVPPEVLHRAAAALGAPRPLAAAASLSLRLVPETTRDARAMSRALRVRGVETRRLSGASQVLVPLTARALDRSLVAEEALLMRGHGAAPTRPRWPRQAVLALVALVLAALVALWGPGRIQAFPTLAVASSAVDLVLVGLVLLVPAWLVLEVDTCSR